MPKQALVRASELFNLAKNLDKFGIKVSDVSCDWQKATERAINVINNCGKGRLEHFMKKGLNLIKGKARFIDPYTVEVNGDRLRAKHIFIATGASYAKLPVEGLEHVITAGDIVKLKKFPKKMVIIGGGPLDLNAHIFSTGWDLKL